MRTRILFLAVAAAIISTGGCISIPEPHILKTDMLIPAQRQVDYQKEMDFPVIFERFVDERTDRAAIGYKLGTMGGPVALAPDRDIAEVFEVIVKKAMDRKGVRSGPSIFVLKGSIQGATVGNMPLSNSIKGQVALEINLVNTKTRGKVWSRSYTGQGMGTDFQYVLGLAFQDLSAAIDKDDSILAMKQVFLASGGILPHATDPEVPQVLSRGGKSPLEKELEDIAVLKAANQNQYAIVIGIEKYRDIKGVEYAAADANTMKLYLNRLMGFPEGNIAVLVNERATKSDIEKYLDRWLKNRVNEKSTVFVYYAGHGAPNARTGDAYIVPFDGDPNYLESTALSLKNFYLSLGELPAERIIVVLDSCFSGAGGRSVLAKGARPLVIAHEGPMVIKKNTIVFTAASGGQISTFYETGGHGLFTYYFLKGISGGADAEKEGVITIESLYQYILPNVEREARLQNSEQTPQLIAAGDSLKLRLISR
jgi:hypothetical protein